MKIASAPGSRSVIGTNLSPKDLDERILVDYFKDWAGANTLIDQFIRLWRFT
jgi:hypothetical protein